jgi:hypothetical protein
MLKVTGGFVPLNRIKFVHDDGRVETMEGDVYQTEVSEVGRDDKQGCHDGV